MLLFSLLALVFLGAAPARPAPGRVPAEALAQERYTFEGDPARLPSWLRGALAHELGQDTLHMAAAGKPWNVSDAITDPSLPGRRLIQAAVGERYAVVHYETGGVAHSFAVVVFAREGAGGARVWSDSVRRAITDRAELEREIKDGTLWAKARTP